tara:strand:+ start:269 stop:445 length:177 start_codon:yes stop_codon:yes gene_type:complete
MKKQPSNWIEGMSMELKQKRYQEQKDFVLRIFVYLILIPSGCVLSWYGLYKLVMWIFS